MKEILLLQHADCEGPGTIGDALNAAHFRIRTVRGDLGEPVPQDLGGASGLVVMGGPMGVYEFDRYPFLRAELLLIEKTAYGRLPVLGVCLGSQLLAAVLGANVVKGPRKEIGWYPVSLEPGASSDPLFGGLPNRFEGFHWHGDIFNLPSGAISLARSELTACQAFRFNQACGVLFHMEVTKDSVSGMVEAFPDELAEAGVTGEQILSDSASHLTQLTAIGEQVFSRWVSGLQKS